MRGVAFDGYGGAGGLTPAGELPGPPGGPATPLVRAHAARGHPGDLLIRSGGLTRA